MDKNAIKKYATWARRELIARVSQKAEQYGITEQNPGELHAESVGGRLLSRIEQMQRDALILRVHRNGYRQVMEEVAYTWFNRFCALRFMEVNGYLPTRIRVFTDENNAFKPQIIAEAIHMEMDGLDMERVYQLKSDNNTEELYKYLLVTQCNALSSILPGMFQRIADYTELLLPDNLLRKGSVIEQLVRPQSEGGIPESDWTDQVQIIGWLYQYYNTEPKDQVFADLKKNIKISKEKIPAATQLFTPDWIVRYMVENSLGRLWLEYGPQGMSCGNGNDALRELWIYYLDEAEQEPEVQEELDRLRIENKISDPSEIKCIDPCMGSGHILAYMFDVLMQIYTAYGYSTREAVQSIVENNLYGLDIDERAAQLAYFALMMKARQYDRRFFTRGIQPHVYSTTGDEEGENFGSLVMVDDLREMPEEPQSMLDLLDYERRLNVWNYRHVLAQKYHVVVTNPPYMAVSNASEKVQDYVKKNYPDSKADLFAVFIERCGQMTAKNGYQAMITQHAWMFLSSFEKLRVKLQAMDTVNMAHLGIGTFEDLNSKVVQSVSFIIRNCHIEGYNGSYNRLFEKPGLQESNEEKAKWLISGKHLFVANQSCFSKIPGSPVAYWVSDRFIDAFRKGENIKEWIDAVASGHKTADNDKYIRVWFEVDRIESKWIPLAKGGDYRKWYGNWSYLLDWSIPARNFYATNKTSNLMKEELCFKPGITWSDISTRAFSCRSLIPEATCETVGPSLLISNEDKKYYILALLNSKYAHFLFQLLNPGLHYKFADVYRVPIIKDRNYNVVINITEENVELSKCDWDSFETSWDFTRHPLVRPVSTIAQAYAAWKAECNDRFNQLKANEEELNRIFIDIYGLQDELTPEVEDKDVTIRRADLGRDIRTLISYAVGCMFGRYSLDVPGLIYAGGDWNESFLLNPVVPDPRYDDNETVMILDGYYVSNRENQYIPCTFSPDKDNILPICDDEYFEDDIVGRFVKFIEVVYGKDTLEENLKFIAEALGGKGSPRDVIRSYFLNDFYADHLKTYQKRPIYWLFDSGKKNGFKCLIYMHRYAPDTIARIRTDYVHEQQSRYRTAIADLENRIAGAATVERVRLTKQLNKLQAQAEEIRLYEEKIHHLADQMIAIDLDDGVKVNYAKFADVLAKIR